MEAIIVAVVAATALVFVVAFNILRSKFSSKNKTPPRRFHLSSLRRISAAYNLSHEQTRLVEKIFRVNSSKDPEQVLESEELLDHYFRNAYKLIGKTAKTKEEAEAGFTKLFRLRNQIESSPGLKGGIPSQLTAGADVALTSANGSYPVKIIGAKGRHVVTSLPRNVLGTPARMPKGARVKLSFFVSTNRGFFVEGDVIGEESSNLGQGLHIEHSGKITAMVQRKARRRQIHAGCEFFGVRLVTSGTGRKKTSKLVVGKKKMRGSVLEISIGGCSIKTLTQIQPGSTLKISVDCGDYPLINVLGQVVRTNRTGRAETIAHIRFSKVPLRAYNVINALVYDYDES